MTGGNLFLLLCGYVAGASVTYWLCVRGREQLRSTRGFANDALAKAEAVITGLGCPGCGAEGAEMAAKCCRDEDCDAGWYGIACDEVAAALAAIKLAKEPT